MSEPVKADLRQCETMIEKSSTWHLGGRFAPVRCESIPTHIVVDKTSGESMSLCAECLVKFKKQCSMEGLTVEKLEASDE